MYGISLNKSLNLLIVQEFSIMLFSPSVVSTSLWPHGLQHTRLPCPSSPTTCSNSCMSIELVMAIQPLHPLPSPSPSIFSSIRVFYSDLALCSRWPKYWSFSISPSVNTQDRFPLGWTGLISLQSKGLSRVFSNTTVQKHQFFSAQPSLWSNSHIHTWLLEKL